MYDTNGNHTGISASSTTEFTLHDEQIPNSFYLEFGEGKYLGMPGTEPHTVKLKGLDQGTFTLEVKEQVGDVTKKEVTFANVPVTASTTGVMVITNLTEATPPLLLLDLDGDGTNDLTLSTAHASFSVFDRIDMAKAYIKTLTMPKWLKDWLLLRFDLTEKLLTPQKKGSLPKGENVAANALLTTVLWTIEHQKGKLLTPEEAGVLKEMVSLVLEQIK